MTVGYKDILLDQKEEPAGLVGLAAVQDGWTGVETYFSTVWSVDELCVRRDPLVTTLLN